jgi:hypothetical protein
MGKGAGGKVVVRRDRQLEALCAKCSQNRCWELSVEHWTLNVWRFLRLPAVAAIALSFPSYSFAEPSPTPQDPPRNLTVVILGDSLSLCGFGKRLDHEFRADPRFKSVFTYMTCGTNPLSWLKEKPYERVQTHCGFWSIESLADSNAIKELTDVYGMTRGHRPKSHPVPKLEDLLATIRPDILVMQTGGNLFGLFSGRENVKTDRDAAALRKYLVPFVEKATAPPSRLRKIYWVAPPTSGRVSGEVQAFMFDQTWRDISGVAKVIDSRTLVSYPYRHMEPDHEHFIGEDMDTWADRVFGVIEQDLSVQPWSSLKPLGDVIVSAPAATPAATASLPPYETSKTPTLVVRAKLVSKSKPIPREELLPYQEFLVAFIYDVEEVIEGEYTEKQILVMHPAYIGLRRQSLRRYHVGRSYDLKLHELEGSLWSRVKSKDDSDRIDLQPYIRIQDEARYPESAR